VECPQSAALTLIGAAGQRCYSPRLVSSAPSVPLAGVLVGKAGRNPPTGSAGTWKVDQPIEALQTGVKGEREMMQQYKANSYLFGGNAPYVEELYEAYLDNPGSVADQWRAYFDALQHVPATDGSDERDVPHAPVVESFAQRAKANAFGTKASATDLAVARKQVHVQSLIAAYRFLGTRWADLDPLKRQERAKLPELEPAFYDLTEADMDISFSATNTYFSTAEQMTLRQIVQALRDTYCGSIGAEYMHITEPTEKRWWQEQLESSRTKPTFNTLKKIHILERLTAAEGLERYLHTKYVGQKRFSLEGGDSFIPAMDELVQRAGEKGVQEIVIGMAHRGRLNVLVNTLGKMPKDLFAEFDHTAPEVLASGDVKYHQGFSSDVSTPGGPVHLSLSFNPSHLEIVNPVVEGSVRANHAGRRKHPEAHQHICRDGRRDRHSAPARRADGASSGRHFNRCRRGGVRRTDGTVLITSRSPRPTDKPAWLLRPTILRRRRLDLDLYVDAHVTQPIPRLNPFHYTQLTVSPESRIKPTPCSAVHDSLQSDPDGFDAGLTVALSRQEAAEHGDSAHDFVEPGSASFTNRLFNRLSPSDAVANSSAAQLIARIHHQIIDLRRIDEVVCNGMA
jgi:2-oxoglutarate dehydrogenase N-terminus